MSRATYLRLSQASPSFALLAACLLYIAGCYNTCVSGTLNSNSPPGGSVGVVVSSPPPSCPLTPANGIVRMQIGASGTIASPTAPHFSHLFVTLAAVQVHADEFAREDAPDWQPLLAFQSRAIQLDLLADAHANHSAASLPDAVLPAGVYRQMLLRFASQPPEAFANQTNPCGGSVPHCAVMSEGRVLPLVFPSSKSALRMPLEDLPGGQLYVPPDGTVALVVQLDPDRSWLQPSADSFLLHPLFRVRRVD
jgi:hypothetical protein